MADVDSVIDNFLHELEEEVPEEPEAKKKRQGEEGIIHTVNGPIFLGGLPGAGLKKKKPLQAPHGPEFPAPFIQRLATTSLPSACPPSMPSCSSATRASSEEESLPINGPPIRNEGGSWDESPHHEVGPLKEPALPAMTREAWMREMGMTTDGGAQQMSTHCPHSAQVECSSNSTRASTDCTFESSVESNLSSGDVDSHQQTSPEQQSALGALENLDGTEMPQQMNNSSSISVIEGIGRDVEEYQQSTSQEQATKQLVEPELKLPFFKIANRTALAMKSELTIRSAPMFTSCNYRVYVRIRDVPVAMLCAAAEAPSEIEARKMACREMVLQLFNLKIFPPNSKKMLNDRKITVEQLLDATRPVLSYLSFELNSPRFQRVLREDVRCYVRSDCAGTQLVLASSLSIQLAFFSARFYSEPGNNPWVDDGDEKVEWPSPELQRAAEAETANMHVAELPSSSLKAGVLPDPEDAPSGSLQNDRERLTGLANSGNQHGFGGGAVKLLFIEDDPTISAAKMLPYHKYHPILSAPPPILSAPPPISQCPPPTSFPCTSTMLSYSMVQPISCSPSTAQCPGMATVSMQYPTPVLSTSFAPTLATPTAEQQFPPSHQSSSGFQSEFVKTVFSIPVDVDKNPIRVPVMPHSVIAEFYERSLRALGLAEQIDTMMWGSMRRIYMAVEGVPTAIIGVSCSEQTIGDSIARATHECFEFLVGWGLYPKDLINQMCRRPDLLPSMIQSMAPAFTVINAMLFEPAYVNLLRNQGTARTPREASITQQAVARSFRVRAKQFMDSYWAKTVIGIGPAIDLPVTLPGEKQYFEHREELPVIPAIVSTSVEEELRNNPEALKKSQLEVPWVESVEPAPDEMEEYLD